MYALQIAIALAVSMLIFSTLATMVLEIIYKVFRLRQMGLKKMLETFYQSEVKQRIQVMLARDGASGEDMPEFIEKITSMTGGSYTLSTIEFIRRLAETDVGKLLAKRAESEQDALIDDITERYEDYGRRASHLFRRYSQIGTVIVSIIIALCLNINAVTIFRTFQTNEELTRSIAGQAEQAMAAYQIQAELLKAAAQNDPSNITSFNEDIEALKGSVQRFRNAVDEAENLGLPIGWSDDKFFNSVDINEMGWWGWLLATVFTGILIGLGGPFWFDMVKRLTMVSQVTGALIRQPSPKDDAEDDLEPKKRFSVVIPEDPRMVFKTVVRAQRIIDGLGAGAYGFLGPKALRL